MIVKYIRVRYLVWLVSVFLLAAVGIFFGFFYLGNSENKRSTADDEFQNSLSQDSVMSHGLTHFNRKTIRQSFTFEKYQQTLVARRDYLLAQKNNVDLVEQILLDRQLELLESELQNIQDNYQKKIELLFETGELILEFKDAITPMEYQKVKQSLLTGDFKLVLELLGIVEKNFSVSLGGDGFDKAAIAAFQQGRIAENDQRPNNAYQSYRRAVKYDPENVEYLLAAGQISDKIALYGKALMYYTAALANLEPEKQTNSGRVRDIYISLGRVYSSQGKIEKAIDSFEKALQIDKAQQKPVQLNLAVDHEHLGMAWEARKNNINARKHYQIAINLYKKIYGKSHQTTKTVTQKLASLP